MLKPGYLRFWKRIAVVELVVNNGGGDGTGCLEIKVGMDATKLSNIIVT